MFKKIFLSAVLFFGLTFVLSGCNLQTNSSDTKSNEQKIKVAVSIYPVYDIAREIAGDKIEVNLVLPPGASPHTFEVSTSQIKKLQNTKIFFTIGGGVDDWTKTISDSVLGSEVVELSDYVDIVSFSNESVNHLPDEENTDGFDPHYWLSPNNAYIMADSIREKLTEVSPDDEEYFLANYNNFVNQLQTKDVEWQEKFSSLKDKNIVVFHDAWGYFADHFGLTISGTFEPFPGQEPTPQYLEELQKTVKENNIKAIFVEPQLSQSSIETLASDLGVEIKVLDPLGGVEGRMSYVEMMDFNVNNVYQLLK